MSYSQHRRNLSDYVRLLRELPVEVQREKLAGLVRSRVEELIALGPIT